MIQRLAALLVAASLGIAGCTAERPEPSWEIDQKSYLLGILGGFSEIVRLGVKELALSEVMSPEKMDDFMAEARKVAERNRVSLYRETDFLVTDLYPAEVAEGKHVLLVYTGDTLDKYLAIKRDKALLLESGGYEGTARKEIAQRFGRLLSYPDDVIEDLIKKNAQPNG